MDRKLMDAYLVGGLWVKKPYAFQEQVVMVQSLLEHLIPFEEDLPENKYENFITQHAYQLLTMLMAGSIYPDRLPKEFTSDSLPSVVMCRFVDSGEVVGHAVILFVIGAKALGTAINLLFSAPSHYDEDAIKRAIDATVRFVTSQNYGFDLPSTFKPILN